VARFDGTPCTCPLFFIVPDAERPDKSSNNVQEMMLFSTTGSKFSRTVPPNIAHLETQVCGFHLKQQDIHISSMVFEPNIAFKTLGKLLSFVWHALLLSCSG
jgi:hypothetical protein